MNISDAGVVRPARRSLRHAALLLHSLAKGDRQWMLAQLASGERAEVASLLDELADLGLPADGTLLTEILKASETTPIQAGQPQADDGALESRVRRLPLGSIVRALRDEPDELIAMVLKLGIWPWQGEFLAQLSAVRRRDVLDLLRGDQTVTAPKKVLADVLLVALCTRADGQVEVFHRASQTLFSTRMSWQKAIRRFVSRMRGSGISVGAVR